MLYSFFCCAGLDWIGRASHVPPYSLISCLLQLAVSSLLSDWLIHIKGTTCFFRRWVTADLLSKWVIQRFVFQSRDACHLPVRYTHTSKAPPDSVNLILLTLTWVFNQHWPEILRHQTDSIQWHLFPKMQSVISSQNCSLFHTFMTSNYLFPGKSTARLIIISLLLWIGVT